MGRLAQPPPPAHRLPRPDTGRVRADLLPSASGPAGGRSLNNLSLRTRRGGSRSVTGGQVPLLDLLDLLVWARGVGWGDGHVGRTHRHARRGSPHAWAGGLWGRVE